MSRAKRIQGVENLHENRQYCRTWPKRFLLLSIFFISMFLSTFPVSVSLMIVLDKTYDRPHCHPHLRKIVKKPWCTSCKIVFIFESRTAWNQSIFSSMDWIDSHLSTPYTQETRRTSNNAKSSRFQEGAWDLNQSWCYQLSYPLEALGICIWSLLASG